jgi:hypothetical protein
MQTRHSKNKNKKLKIPPALAENGIQLLGLLVEGGGGRKTRRRRRKNRKRN